MAGKKVAVFGMYRRPDDAEEAIGALIIKGFPSENISALIPEDLATRSHKPEPVPLEEEAARHFIEKEISRGTLGLLDHVGAVSLPDVGLLIGAGPLMSALSNPQSVAASGSVATALQEMGAPPSDVKRCERLLKNRAIVSVRCADSEWAQRARQILDRSGAERLSSPGQQQPKVKHGGASLF